MDYFVNSILEKKYSNIDKLLSEMDREVKHILS